MIGIGRDFYFVSVGLHRTAPHRTFELNGSSFMPQVLCAALTSLLFPNSQVVPQPVKQADCYQYIPYELPAKVAIDKP